MGGQSSLEGRVWSSCDATDRPDIARHDVQPERALWIIAWGPWRLVPALDHHDCAGTPLNIILHTSLCQIVSCLRRRIIDTDVAEYFPAVVMKSNLASHRWQLTFGT